MINLVKNLFSQFLDEDRGELIEGLEQPYGYSSRHNAYVWKNTETYKNGITYFCMYSSKGQQIRFSKTKGDETLFDWVGEFSDAESKIKAKTFF